MILDHLGILSNLNLSSCRFRLIFSKITLVIMNFNDIFSLLIHEIFISTFLSPMISPLI